MEKITFKQWWGTYWMAPFSWSKWTDVMVFNFGGSAYLLQGQVNQRTNSKRFKVVSFKRPLAVVQPSHITMDDLNKTGIVDQQVKWN